MCTCPAAACRPPACPACRPPAARRDCPPGDLTNSYADFDREGLTDLGRRLAAVAPCYAVAGNHELRFGRTGEYARLLERAGVRVLRDGWTLLEREGETLTLYGMERKRPRPCPPPAPGRLSPWPISLSGCICTRPPAGIWSSAATPTAGRCA